MLSIVSTSRLVKVQVGDRHSIGMWLVVENKMAGTDSAECFICRSSPGAHLVVLEKSCEYNGQLIVEGE